MRLALASLVVLLALAAPAAAAPQMSPATRTAIGNVVDRFVKDVVRRENLAEGWTLAGPDLRGGTTRKAWVAGTGVTVAYYPAAGNDFRDAWTGHLVSPTRAELAMVLHPKPGSGEDITAPTIDVRKIRGRWVVDIFYTAAVIRSSGKHRGSCGTTNCAVSGPNDFGPAAGGSAYGNSSSRISSHWLWIGLAGIGAIVLATPLGIFMRIKRRDRRAWSAAYSEADSEPHRPSS
jgi:hypothetical protein